MDHSASTVDPAFQMLSELLGSSGKSVPLPNLAWPAAGGSGKSLLEPELTPQGWKAGLSLPAEPGERHGAHLVQSPNVEAPSMLYVRSLCSSAASPPPSVGGGA